MWFILVFSASPCAGLDVKDVPNPRDHGGWVSDPADVIPSVFEKRVNRLLSRLHQRTTAEVAVVALQTIDGATAHRKFGLDLFNQWGIGDARKQNGVLILILEKDRRIEIITGRGFGAKLSDAAARHIVDQMLPFFTNGDAGGGTLEGVKQIVATLRNIDRNQTAVVYPLVAWIAAVPALLGVAWLVWFRQRGMAVPAAGRCDVAHLNIAKISFRELVNACVRIPRWPALPAWLATAALTVLGASAASVALAGPAPDLEIGFMRFTLVGAAGSSLVMFVLLPFVRPDAFKVAGALALAFGILLWLICNWALWSDQVTVGILVPCIVAAINLVSAKFVTTELVRQS